MDWNRRKTLIVRWSFLSAGIIAAFWLGWHLVAGEVPTVTSLQMTESWTLTLPFAVSRWFDVLMGPLWSAATVLFITNGKLQKKDGDQIVGLVIALVSGLVIALVSGLVFALVSGLVFGLVFGLGFGLVNWRLSLTFALVFALVVGLPFGLIVSLPLFLIFGLACILTIGAPASFLSKSWHSLGRWLLGKDTVSSRLRFAQLPRLFRRRLKTLEGITPPIEVSSLIPAKSLSRRR